MTAAMKLEGTESVGEAPILAFASDAETIEQIGRIVPGGRRGADIYEGGTAEAARALDQGAMPTVVIVDISGSAQPVDEIAELSAISGPGCAVIAIGAANDIGLYRHLVAAGAADYLVKPLDPQDLRRAILTAHSGESRQSEPERRGEVICVVGARGGVGSTSVAIGTAWLLSDGFGRNTALVDLDLQFGTAALSLDLEPGSGMRNALEHPDRIDSLFIASAMVSYSDKLSVLGGEEPLDELIEFKPEAFKRLTDEVADIAEILVCDIPRHMIGAAGELLGSAKAILLVTDLSLPGLRDAMRLRTALERLAPQVPLKVVANRVGHAKGVELSRAEFEKSLDAKIDCLLGEDPKAGKQMLNGKPLAAGSAKGKTAEALRSLVQQIVEPPEDRPGLLARLLGGTDKAKKKAAKKG